MKDKSILINRPVKGSGGGKSKKEFEEEIRQLLTIINFLREELKKQPSQLNQDKLKKAEEKLESFLYTQSPLIFLTIGVVILVIGGIGLLIFWYINRELKNTKKYR